MYRLCTAASLYVAMGMFVTRPVLLRSIFISIASEPVGERRSTRTTRGIAASRLGDDSTMNLLTAGRQVPRSRQDRQAPRGPRGTRGTRSIRGRGRGRAGGNTSQSRRESTSFRQQQARSSRSTRASESPAARTARLARRAELSRNRRNLNGMDEESIDNGGGGDRLWNPFDIGQLQVRCGQRDGRPY